MCVCARMRARLSMCSGMSNSVTPRTVAPQASLSIEFSRQEYWSGLAFPPPGDLPDPGIKPTAVASLALQEDSLPLHPPHPGKPLKSMHWLGNNKKENTLMSPKYDIHWVLGIQWWTKLRICSEEVNNSQVMVTFISAQLFAERKTMQLA